MAIEHASTWPLGAPPAKPGPAHLPCGREVFWTGRVAIGLRHQPAPDHNKPVPQSTLWLQALLLRR